MNTKVLITHISQRHTLICHQWYEYFLWELSHSQGFKRNMFGKPPIDTQGIPDKYQYWYDYEQKIRISLFSAVGFSDEEVLSGFDPHYADDIKQRISKWYNPDDDLTSEHRKSIEEYRLECEKTEHYEILWLFRRSILIADYEEELTQLQSKCEQLLDSIRKTASEKIHAQHWVIGQQSVLKRWYASAKDKAEARKYIAEYPTEMENYISTLKSMFDEFAQLIQRVQEIRAIVLG